MIKFAQVLVGALTTSIGVLAGCGTAPASSAPTTSAPPAASTGLTGNIATTFTNAVPETPWWDKVAAPPTSAVPATLTWTLSGDILFDSGSATLSPSALSQVSGIISAAQRHCDATIRVLGYTDSVPDPSFPGGNQGLSSARASAVANVIEEARIPGDRVQAAGEGASNPVGDNNTSVGRQANRRVVIQLFAPAASCPGSSASNTVGAG